MRSGDDVTFYYRESDLDPWTALVAFDLGFLQNLGLSPALGQARKAGRTAV